eukprot:m.52965 g.52965  ORF g.52965 m.52965 type:complete len:174 (-) comp15434_c0_seq13:379-900(-)
MESEPTMGTSGGMDCNGFSPTQHESCYRFTTVGGRSARQNITLSSTAFLSHNLKIVFESAGGKNKWVEPQFPAFDNNGSTKGLETPGPRCNPCLFDVVNDPREMHDLSQNASFQQVLGDLWLALNASVLTTFQTGDDGYDGGYTQCVTNDAYKATHGGFIGPLCTKPTRRHSK